MSAAGTPTEIHVTKVNGRAGAEAYNMPPNSDDLLLDMNDPILYHLVCRCFMTIFTKNRSKRQLRLRLSRTVTNSLLIFIGVII